MTQQTSTQVKTDAGPSVPSHVPTDLVMDIDIYHLARGDEDVFSAWADLSRRCKQVRGGNAPLVYTPHNGGHWIATTAHALEELFPEVDHLSNAAISIPAHEGPHIVPGEADGEEHVYTRRAVMRAFSPSAIKAMRGTVRAIVDKLVADVRPRGSCEFMSEFAFRLPMHLFLSMMSLPIEDGPELLGYTEALIRGKSDAERAAGWEGLWGYLQDVVDSRASEPGEDLISQMSLAPYGDDPMPRALVHSICVNLLIGGLDTVASMLGFFIRHLAEDDELRRRLAADPSLIEASIAEVTRRFPVTALGRLVSSDFQYGDVTLMKGDRLLLPTALHAMDADRFEAPLEFRASRDIPILMSFGRGRHQCVGSLLARVELGEAIASWLAGIPEFRVAAGKTATVSCGQVNAMASLPLEWEI